MINIPDWKVEYTTELSNGNEHGPQYNGGEFFQRETAEQVFETLLKCGGIKSVYLYKIQGSTMRMVLRRGLP